MRKRGFTLMELLVYMAIVGIVVIVAGQAFSDSTKMRIRTQGMIKANEIATNIGAVIKDDISQMGAKSSKEYTGAMESDGFSQIFSDVYMDLGNVDVSKIDCSTTGASIGCTTGYTEGNSGSGDSGSSEESSSSENSGNTGESTNEPATFNQSSHDYKINNGTTIVSIETNQYNCPTIYCKSSSGNMTAILDGENMGTGNWLNKETSGCTTGTTTYSLTVNVDDALCGYW